jgi:hypothetical protein
MTVIKTAIALRHLGNGSQSLIEATWKWRQSAAHLLFSVELHTALSLQLKRLILLQKQRSEFSLMQKSHYSSTNSNYMSFLLYGGNTSPMRASPFACSIYSRF